MALSYVGHDSSIRGTRLIHLWDMTHPYVGHDSFIRVTRLIHMCDTTHSYAGHNAFIRGIWLTHTRGHDSPMPGDMTHPYSRGRGRHTLRYRVCVTHECSSMVSRGNCKFFIFFPPPQKKESSTRATHPQISSVRHLWVPVYGKSKKLWVSYLFFPTKKKILNDWTELNECASLMSARLWRVKDIVSFLFFFDLHKKELSTRATHPQISVCVTLDLPSTYTGGILLKIISLFCKRALQKRRCSAKDTYDFKEPTDRSLCLVEEIISFLSFFFPPRNFCCLNDFVLLCYRSQRGRHACFSVYG